MSSKLYIQKGIIETFIDVLNEYKAIGDVTYSEETGFIKIRFIREMNIESFYIFLRDQTEEDGFIFEVDPRIPEGSKLWKAIIEALFISLTDDDLWIWKPWGFSKCNRKGGHFLNPIESLVVFGYEPKWERYVAEISTEYGDIFYNTDSGTFLDIRDGKDSIYSFFCLLRDNSNEFAVNYYKLFTEHKAEIYKYDNNQNDGPRDLI